jgi:DNA-binding beta-propeller fold protein YncE
MKFGLSSDGSKSARDRLMRFGAIIVALTQLSVKVRDGQILVLRLSPIERKVPTIEFRVLKLESQVPAFKSGLCPFSGSLSESSILSWLITCGIPQAIAVNPSNGLVYVADLTDRLHVFSQTQYIGNVFGGSGPAIQVNSATGYVYVDLWCGWLGIVSGTQYITDFVVGSEVGAIGVNPASSHVYATDEISDTVKILSGADVIATQATGHDPRAIAVDAERGYVYIANAASDEVTVLSGTEVLATIPVGAVKPDPQMAVVLG